MSIDLNWEALTQGPDGLRLAEEIRAYIHEKFHTVTLPGFLRSVHVTAFEFGSVPPTLELKDICDPLPDFYEEPDGTSDLDGDDDEDEEKELVHDTFIGPGVSGASHIRKNPSLTQLDTRLGVLHAIQHHHDLASPGALLGVSTPGIPGGTSNLGYFHTQLASGLSGTQTPLAAVAAARFAPRNEHAVADHQDATRPSKADLGLRERQSVSTLTSANPTRPPTRDGDSIDEDSDGSIPPKYREARPDDIQTVFHVSYAGDIRLSLTAEILLDYPMPSFAGIPLKLNITGISFDGIAVLAYIRKRAYFCFLSPEDAESTLGREAQSPASGALRVGGLLQEIKVESEIGQRDGGKQSLRNIGKVEKFVLEQVRHIFEDELVYPSFWTFLV